jgi:hypothetical protein
MQCLIKKELNIDGLKKELKKWLQVMDIKVLSILYWREWRGERDMFMQSIVDRWNIALILMILMKVTVDLEAPLAGDSRQWSPTVMHTHMHK